jgi:hypothetical protein
MLAHKVREIQVVDTDGKVIGLLDEADISRCYIEAADRTSTSSSIPIKP